MDIKLLLISILFFVIGIIIMIKNKFFKYHSSDMLFASKLKIFLSGLLFLLIGLYGLFCELVNLL